MNDYIADPDRLVLARHGLDSFKALWALKLEAVDEPNIERGGWSSVYRLELEDSPYYLKRQSNHLTRSLRHPLGEPTFAREYRNIRRYQRLGIPSLQASFFGVRKVTGEQRAILLTRALDGWEDMGSYLMRWAQLDEACQQAIVTAVGELARLLHQAGQVHGCFYPKHIFLREQEGRWQARLIDLEKTRPLLWGPWDRIRDLEPLLRRAQPIGEEGVRRLLLAYLQDEGAIERWLQRLKWRRQHKESRG